MAKRGGAVHVSAHRRHYVGKDGVARDYETHLLRRTYRDGAKVKHETLANLSALPASAIEAVRAALAGQTLVPAGTGLSVTRSLPHGHVAAVAAQAQRARVSRAARPGLPAPGRRARVAARPGRGAGLEAGHHDVVGRHHPRARPGRGRRVHRRGVRRDGLARRTAGRPSKSLWPHGI